MSLQSLLTAFCRRPRIAFGAAALLAVAGALLVSRVSFDANILNLLPKNSPPVRSFQTFLQDFGSLDHLYVVFESRDPIGGHTALVDAYVEALHGAPEVASVDAQLFESSKDWSYLFDRELYLLGPHDTRTALARFTPPALDAELAHARDMLSAPSADVKAYVQNDPLGLLAMLRDRMGRQKGLIDFDPTQEGYVSADGRSRLVIVKPAGAPFDTDFCKTLFARLASVERQARSAAAEEDEGAGRVSIQAAGAYRVSLESEQLIRREAIVNSIGSMVVLLAIVFALFRAPGIMLYGVVPLALAALLALGITGLIQGTLSPATSGSAGMLFGLGIDGVIVLYARYLEERERGCTPADAVAGMTPAAWSVILAQVTTAATFLALLLIDFPTLQDLGGLAGAGMLICCGLTLVLMPAFFGRDARARRTRALRSAWLGALVTRHAAIISVAGIAATIVLTAAATRLHVDPSLDRLQAQTRGAALEREVADRFNLPRDILLVVNENADLERLIDADARLTAAMAREDPAMSVGGVSLLLPPAADQEAVAREVTASGLTPARAAAALRDGAARAGFTPNALAPFLERLPRILDARERITYAGLVEHGLDPIVSRFVARRGATYSAVTYLYPRGTVDVARLDRAVRAIDPGMRLTGVPIVNRDLAERFPRQFAKGVAIGVAAVALIIFSVFRTVRYTLLALLPTAVGFAWSAGVLALAGVDLDLFSMFAAVAFIGIAVDYGIYVLYRYAVEGTRDVGLVLTESGAAIMIACLTALVGFGTLVNSSYGPLRTFGLVSLVTLTCCLTASLVLLPALVVQTERWSRSAR